MPFDPSKFYVGVNIGWLNHWHGHDITIASDPAKREWGTTSDSDFEPYVSAIFTHLRLRHISVARIFLLEEFEGLNFYFPSTRICAPSNVDFINREIQEQFLQRVRIIMNQAHNNNIQIYWCLFDAANLLGESATNWEPTAFRNIVNVDSVKELFINNVLSPFLRTIVPYTENIFAIDIINEIDWLWYRLDFRIEVVARFARDVKNHINAQAGLGNVKITSSFAGYSRLQTQHSHFDFFDFFDYHRYYDRLSAPDQPHGSLPVWNQSQFGNKVCIIGEIGNRHRSNEETLRTRSGNTRSEQEQQEATEVLLRSALDGHYFGALAWRYTFNNGWNPGRPEDLANDFTTRLLKKGTASGDFRKTTDVVMREIITIGNTRPTDANAFDRYERPVWNNIITFISSLPPSRRI